MNLKRRHDSRKRHPQLTMYAELAENEKKRAWTRDATCAGWNANALPVDHWMWSNSDYLRSYLLVVPARDVTQKKIKNYIKLVK